MTEQELLDKAELVEWDGNPIAMLDYFFRSWEDMVDTVMCEKWQSIPEYVFATKRCVIPYLDASDIVERIMEELEIDHDNEPKINGIAELQEALDAFREANKNINYFNIDIKHKVKVLQSVTDEVSNNANL